MVVVEAARAPSDVRDTLFAEASVDFVAVLEELLPFFEERELLYGVIGGVALGSYGMVRATVDLDLIIDASSQDEVIRYLESRGYRTLHRSSGYSNHQHPEPEKGGVDVVYVGGETSRRVFAATRRLQGPGGRTIPVPSPEHLIAMKVIAMKNDASRRFQDMVDSRFLLSLPGVDRNQVRAQFEKHGLLETYLEIESP
jgi:hypothetical protein